MKQVRDFAATPWGTQVAPCGCEYVGATNVRVCFKHQAEADERCSTCHAPGYRVRGGAFYHRSTASTSCNFRRKWNSYR